MDSKEVWDCFPMAGVRMLHFKKKEWWKFMQIHKYYTMTLTTKLFIPDTPTKFLVFAVFL